jgi:hypothetical protein
MELVARQLTEAELEAVAALAADWFVRWLDRQAAVPDERRA